MAILAQDSKLNIAEKILQQGLEAVTTWSMDRKMLLSEQKSERSLLLTNSHKSRWQPTLTVHGQLLCYNSTPKFLEVTYDHRLTFSRHAAFVCNSLMRQTGALQMISTTSWRYDRQALLATYNRAFEGGIPFIFVAAVDIELNVGESGKNPTLRRTIHHRPASRNSCRSNPCRREPPIDKDKSNPAEYFRHG